MTHGAIVTHTPRARAAGHKRENSHVCTYGRVLAIDLTASVPIAGRAALSASIMTLATSLLKNLISLQMLSGNRSTIRSNAVGIRVALWDLSAHLSGAAAAAQWANQVARDRCGAFVARIATDCPGSDQTR